MRCYYQVFGTISGDDQLGFPLATSSGSGNVENVLMPYLSTLSEFREDVRTIARQNKGSIVVFLSKMQ